MFEDERRDKDATLNEIGTFQLPGNYWWDCEKDHHIMNTFWSLDDAAAKCEEVVSERHKAQLNSFGLWGGGDTFADVMRFCREGWDEKVAEANWDVEETVRRIEAQYALTTRFQPQHDVQGGMVDMDAYLHGMPENMISYPPIQSMGHGRIVNIVGSISASAGTGPDAYYQRGCSIGALALALERQGMQTELWLDDSAVNGSYSMTNRVLVKGPSETLDMSKVMLAFAHPGALRHLAFGLMSAFRHDWHNRIDAYPGNYGGAVDANHVHPEGTIYLPAMFGDQNPDEALVQYLDQLGVLDAEETELVDWS